MLSLFDKIRSAKRAATVHTQAATLAATSSAADADPASLSRPAYRHIPTHAALDSLTLGQPHTDAELHDRIRAEGRKRRALARLSGGGSGSGSEVAGYEAKDGDGQAGRLYSHASFEALVNTRPRFGGVGRSPKGKGRCRSPIGGTLELSVSDFPDGPSDVALGKRRVGGPALTSGQSVQNLRSAMTSKMDASGEKAARKAKQVKFTASTVLLPVQDDNDRPKADTPPSSSGASPLSQSDSPVFKTGNIPLVGVTEPQSSTSPWKLGARDESKRKGTGENDVPLSAKSWIRDNSFSEPAADARFNYAVAEDEDDAHLTTSYHRSLDPFRSPDDPELSAESRTSVESEPLLATACHKVRGNAGPNAISTTAPRPRSMTDPTFLGWKRLSAAEIDLISPFLKFEHEATPRDELHYSGRFPVLATAAPYRRIPRDSPPYNKTQFEEPKSPDVRSAVTPEKSVPKYPETPWPSNYCHKPGGGPLADIGDGDLKKDTGRHKRYTPDQPDEMLETLLQRTMQAGGGSGHRRCSHPWDSVERLLDREEVIRRGEVEAVEKKKKKGKKNRLSFLRKTRSATLT